MFHKSEKQKKQFSFHLHFPTNTLLFFHKCQSTETKLRHRDRHWPERNKTDRKTHTWIQAVACCSACDSVFISAAWLSSRVSEGSRYLTRNTPSPPAQEACALIETSLLINLSLQTLNLCSESNISHATVKQKGQKVTGRDRQHKNN